MKAAIFCFALIFLVACSTAPQGPAQVGGGQNEPSCICTADYAPVCGSDGRTYSNACTAGCAKVDYISGECA